jgi:NADPH-dependent curcumin reductase CurA
MRPGVQAYTALHYQLRIAKGDTVLVTRGCFEGRQAIIQLASHWGGRVFVTAYSREEVGALLEVVDEFQIIDLSR